MVNCANNELTINILRDYFEKYGLVSPIVIGGLGGSGTRLVVSLLREMSVQMGKNVNVSEDALYFIELYDQFVTHYLLNQIIDIPVFQIRLLSAIKAHRQNMTHENWGWKNPRSIHLLPVFDKFIPSFCYIHVIRHGFDMINSSNKTQLEKYQHCVLSAEQQALPLELRSLVFWEVVNRKAASYGLSHMGNRYHLLRYEDVCANPTEAMQPIAKQLGLSLPKVWQQTIVLPQERKHHIKPDCLNSMRAISTTALERFGYSC